MTERLKSNEWYTPSKYIEAARTVLGGIDLDPASCEFANRTVKATKYYTIEDNGLKQEWGGRMWINPPYGRIYKNTGTTAFVARLIDEYTAGNVEQAIILTMMGMYASWFFRLLQYHVCFLEQKPLFSLPDGTGTRHGFAACCTYLGPNEARFIEVFSQFGRVVMAIDTPKPKLAMRELWMEAEA
jgi:DNA N-6-adenine-methyltransferase (Dam)